MSIFIKSGLWANKAKGYLGELNLTKFIKDLIAEVYKLTNPDLPFDVPVTVKSKSPDKDQLLLVVVWF